MQSSAIHDPLEGTTPSQRLAAAEHLRRMQRIKVAARFEPAPAVFQAPIPNSAMSEAHELLKTNYSAVLGQVEAIQRAVLSFYPPLTMTDMKSIRRTDNIVRPRQIAMYIAKQLTSRTLPDIGRRFGGRDHTTVLHAVRKIARQIECDPALAFRIEEIKAALAGTA